MVIYYTTWGCSLIEGKEWTYKYEQMKLALVHEVEESLKKEQYP